MKKPVEKPNKFKMDLALDNCKESINETLTKYEGKIESLIYECSTMSPDSIDFKNRRDRLTFYISQKKRMQQMYSRVEAVEAVVDEAFAQQDLFQSMGTVLTEINKINFSPEMKKMLKDVNAFDQIFKKTFTNNQLFDNITKGISNIDDDVKISADKEIQQAIEEENNKIDREIQDIRTKNTVSNNVM